MANQIELTNTEVTILESDSFKSALTEARKYKQDLDVEFATPEEKDSNGVKLYLQHKHSDKNFMLIYWQDGAQVSPENRGSRISVFNYYVSKAGGAAGLHPFNQIPDHGGRHEVSGWEFWAPDKAQATILDFAMLMAEEMGLELKTDEDIRLKR